MMNLIDGTAARGGLFAQFLSFTLTSFAEDDLFFEEQMCT